MARRTPAQRLRRLLAPLLVALLLIAAAPASAQRPARIWCAAPAPIPTTAPCTNGETLTLLRALASAQSGDQIRLARGVYTGGDDAVLRVSMMVLTIVGGYGPGSWAAPAGDPALTVLDAQGARRGVYIQSAGVLLANLTIRSGRAGAPGSSAQGGGLFAEQNQAGLVILDNVVVRDSQASGSGGGVASFGPVELYDVSLIGNTAGEDGGGLWAGGEVIFVGGHVAANRAARHGGGSYLSRCDCEGLRFQGNTAGSSGGAVLFAQASSFSGSAFIDNRAGEAGGAIAQELSSEPLTVSDSVFVGNVAQDLPGSNVDNPNSGGAISVQERITVERSRFERNRTTGSGGAILQRALGGQVTVTESRLASNTADGDGGAIALLGAVTLEGVELVANTAGRNGGGLAQIDPENGRLPGPAALSRLTVTGNRATAGSGGGLSLAEPFELSGALVAGNTAGLDGGGIAMRAPAATFRAQPLRIERAMLRDNRATAGSGGGAFLATTAGVELDGLAVSGNVAGLRGGGIAQEGGETLTMRGVLLADNSAGQGGAGLSAEDGMYSLLRGVALTNVTVASAQPHSSAAIAIADNTVAVTLTNTLVTSHTTGVSLGAGAPGGGAPTLTGDYVGFFGVANPVAGPGGPLPFSPPNSFGADPQFRDPARGDYGLAAGSPLIGQGDPGRDYAGQIDAAGRRVPLGGRAEVGALELVSLTPRLYLPLVARTPLYPALP